MNVIVYSFIGICICYSVFCSDHEKWVIVWCRSSKAPDVEKPVLGSKVPVFSDEKLSMRVLVSVCEWQTSCCTSWSSCFLCN